MRRAIVDGEGDLGVGHHLGRIEHAQAEAGGKEPPEGHVQRRLVDEALLHRRQQRRVGLAAVQVAAGDDRQGRSLGGGVHQLVVQIDIADGAAVGHHIAVEAPLVAQDLLQKRVAGAADLAVGAVVGAHDGDGAPLADRGLEMGQVGLQHVALAGDGIEMVAVVLGPAVHDIVFGRGHQLQVLVIVALQAPHKDHAEPGGQIGVLAIGLLAPSPARVAKDIDVGRPVGEPRVALADAVAQALVVLGPCLVRDGDGHAEQEVLVPGGGHADGLGEDGGDSRAPHPVETLVPPVVRRHAQPLDGGRGVQHLGDLFLDGHARYEIVQPLRRGERGVHEGVGGHGSSLK